MAERGGAQRGGRNKNLDGCAAHGEVNQGSGDIEHATLLVGQSATDISVATPEANIQTRHQIQHPDAQQDPDERAIDALWPDAKISDCVKQSLIVSVCARGERERSNIVKMVFGRLGHLKCNCEVVKQQMRRDTHGRVDEHNEHQDDWTLTRKQRRHDGEERKGAGRDIKQRING